MPGSSCCHEEPGSSPGPQQAAAGLPAPGTQERHVYGAGPAWPAGARHSGRTETIGGKGSGVTSHSGGSDKCSRC